MSSFARLPPDMFVYYLDTNVWGSLVKNKSTSNSCIDFFQSRDRVAALSYFTLFELSRASNMLDEFDELFFAMRNDIRIPCLYDQVVEGEVENYPNEWEMRWLPLSILVDETQPNILSKFASDTKFIKSRDEHFQFGREQFMSLKQLKENFPSESDDEYSTDEADFFAWCNTVDYLGRHFPRFLLRFKGSANTLNIDSLLSLRIRSLFIFYKYYIHDQSPGRTDFLDFAHVSYAPYCHAYVTERNVYNVLMRIKNSGLMLSKTQPIHITKFLRKICRG